MSAHYTTIGQVARQHHQAGPASSPRTPALTRRLVAAMAKLGVTSAQVPDAS